MPTPKEVLTEALRLIKKGWTKGAMYDPDTDCYCAAGALQAAAGPYGMAELLARDILKEVIKKHCSGIGIVTFNDDPRTTKGKVIAVFKEAIDLA